MKSNLYTRTGDTGTTSLVDGSRAQKDSVRIEAYGDIDELSSALGLICADSKCPELVRGQIAAIQNIMFEIGGYLATPVADEAHPALHGIEEDTRELEGWIDALDEMTPKIRSFILPGGCEGACRCHLARTVCRRAERKIITLARNSYVDPALISYINRLSDYLFIAARYLNFVSGEEEIIWHSRNRK